jgi:hypothetical protein
VNNLITKLRAAIDEDERIAEATAETYGGTWEDGGKRGEFVTTPYGGRVACGPHDGCWYDGEIRQHIARHDPARVLGRVAADRKILDWVKSCDGWDAEWDKYGIEPLSGMPSTDELVAALAQGYGIEVPM